MWADGGLGAHVGEGGGEDIGSIAWGGDMMALVCTSLSRHFPFNHGQTLTTPPPHCLPPGRPLRIVVYSVKAINPFTPPFSPFMPHLSSPLPLPSRPAAARPHLLRRGPQRRRYLRGTAVRGPLPPPWPRPCPTSPPLLSVA